MTDMPRRRVTIDDLLDLDTVGSLALSPDGALALFVTGKHYDEGEKDKRSPKTIMAASLVEGTVRPYSAGAAVDSQPRWSPDGATVAFLSDRPHDLPAERHAARTQLYLLPRAGGEARRLTAAEGDIGLYAWLPGGAGLVVTMTDAPSAEERQREEERGGAVDVEERPRYARLWRVDAATGEATALTPAGAQVWDFGLAPDGRSAAVVVSDHPYEWSWYGARLAVADFDGPSRPGLRTIYTTSRQLAGPRWSPDGATVAVTSCAWSDRGYYGGDVVLAPVDGGEARTLTAGRPVSVTWLEWEGEGDGASLLCAGYEEGEIALWRLGLDGDLGLLWRAEACFAEPGQARFARAGDTIAALRQDTAHPVDLWTARLKGDHLGEWRRVTHLHPRCDAWDLREARTLRWRAPDGTAIQGLLALPPDVSSEAPRGPLPLVVLVHGGPAGLTAHTFGAGGPWTRLLTARGFAVLMPNPRGSVGWGTAYTEANLGDMGGADFGDIMAGVDAAVAAGVADPARLGIGGWSYGGFMTAWAVTQTDRFKAAVMGAGIADWRSFHGVSNIPTWDALFYGSPGQPADPYEPAGPYARFSPLAHVGRARTPTLILHGEKDECVPVGQGYQFLRALRERGVPSAMTVYPRAGHGPRERAHQKDAATKAVDWFARYVVETQE